MDLPSTATGAADASTLWTQFAAPLRSFVARRAPHETEPEDLLQDVFVRVQEQLPRLREADRVDAWIFQIARNVVADAFRKRARGLAKAADAHWDEAQLLADDEDRSAEASLVRCLASMIAELPEPFRTAIELTELQGMTQAEAARVVGISISGMKSRVQRGRERLAVIIRDFCRIETDVRGGVITCDPLRSDCGAPLRPSSGSRDSMDMQTTKESQAPETTTTTDAPATGCCGGPAPQGSNACCSLDAKVKDAGGSGCGCGAKPSNPAKKGCC